MRGPPPEKIEESKPSDDYSVPSKSPAALQAGGGDDGGGMAGMLAILGDAPEEQ
jgi:hypothetical protein